MPMQMTNAWRNTRQQIGKVVNYGDMSTKAEEKELEDGGLVT